MPKLTFERTLILVTFLLAIIASTRQQSYDPDLYWHIRSGEVMIDTGKLITGDIFSHTLPGVFRPHHEWLTEIIIAWLHRVMSDYGVTLFALFTSIFSMAWMYRLLKGTLSVRLAMALLVVNITSTTAMARPQGWMLIFTIILVGIILSRQPKQLRWIPIIMLIWVNLHGGWITGYVVLGAAVVSEGIKVFILKNGDIAWLRRLILWSLAGVLALMINPYGFDQLLVPLDTFTQAARPYISEWNPPYILTVKRIPFLIILILNILVILKNYRRISLLEYFLTIGFAVWALTTARVVLIYTFVAPIIITPYLSEWLLGITPKVIIPEDVLRRPIRLGLPIVAGLALMAVVLFITGSRPAFIRAVQETNYPANAVDFLRDSDAPREIFHTYHWGGYLMYYLPQYPVFIDGRADLYDEFYFVYKTINNAEEGWQAKLEEYNVNTILVRPDEDDIAMVLRTEADWRVIYEDDVAVIFQRTP